MSAVPSRGDVAQALMGAHDEYDGFEVDESERLADDEVGLYGVTDDGLRFAAYVKVLRVDRADF